MAIQRQHFAFIFQILFLAVLLILFGRNINQYQNIRFNNDFKEFGYTFGPTTSEPVQVPGIVFSDYRILTIHSADFRQMDRFSVHLPFRVDSFGGLHVRLEGEPHSVDLTLFSKDLPGWRQKGSLKIVLERYADRVEMLHKNKVLVKSPLAGNTFEKIVIEDRNSHMALTSFDLLNDKKQIVIHHQFASLLANPLVFFIFVFGGTALLFWLSGTLQRIFQIESRNRALGYLLFFVILFWSGTFIPVDFPLKKLIYLLLIISVIPIAVFRISFLRRRFKHLTIVAYALMPAFATLSYLLFRPDAGSILAPAMIFSSACLLTALLHFHRKKIKGFVILMILMLIATCLAAEWALRNSLLDTRLRPMNLGKEYIEHDDLLFVPGALFQTEDDFKIGSLRFRDKDADVQKPANTFRIITMGGSNCYGDGLDDNSQTFSTALEECLNKEPDEISVEVLNAGVKGFNLFQLSKLFENYALDYHPDMLILYININDSAKDFGPFTYKELWQLKQSERWKEVEQTIRQSEESPNSNGWVQPIQQFLQPFRLYNLFSNKITRTRNQSLRPIAKRFKVIKDVNPSEDYRENLKQIIRLCQDRNIKLILADAFSVDYSEDPGAKAMVVRNIMKEEAKKLKVPMVPVNDLLLERQDKRSLVFAHDPVHINRKGHQVVGELLCTYIKEGGYLP